MEELEKLRYEIDKIDNEIVQLFAKRFDAVKRIGKIKKENGIKVLDENRFQRVLGQVEEIAINHGLSKDFIDEIYHVVHKYACRVENDLEI